MMMTENHLSTKAYWSESWSVRRVQDITFDPQRSQFRDLHVLFEETLPHRRNLRFLEIGCYPGRFMWYFDKFFNYDVSGLEYVDWCSQHCRQLLQAAGVKAEVIHGDLFTYMPAETEIRYDVVASFGLIEHFENMGEVIQRHLDLLKPGGYLVLTAPNLQGLYGYMMKTINYKVYQTHNPIGYEDMSKALKQTDQVEILAGGYYGRLGFANTGLYARVKPMGRLIYLLVRGPLWTLEQGARFLPNSKLSPIVAVIAKKLG